jgi:hypothetical protein
MTAAALGLATGLDTPAVSSQLTRLEKSGYVEAVALSSRGKGRSGYQVSERFFNIWYLMRNGSRRVGQRIGFLIQFMQASLNPDERQALAARADSQALPPIAPVRGDAEGQPHHRLLGQPIGAEQGSGVADATLPLLAEERRPSADLVRLPAQAQADIAHEAGSAISPAGRQLLFALTIPDRDIGPDWPAVFDAVGKAMTVDDPTLWTRHLDDLLGLLCFILAQGQGQAFRLWMDKAGIRDRHAPLYHAFVAALDGEDHLLQISPEVRQPAARIHAGLAQRLRPYGGDKGSRKSEPRRRSG